LTNKVHDPHKYRTEFLNEDLDDRDFDDVPYEPDDRDSCPLSIPLSPRGANGVRFDSRRTDDTTSQLREDLGLPEMSLDPRNGVMWDEKIQSSKDSEDRFVIKATKVKKLNLNV
jgi:hypothetical protein